VHYTQVFCQSKFRKAVHVYLILCYNDSLATWTAVNLTTAKFKPFIFFMPASALSYIANMFILIILYDFCLLPEQFCYMTVYIWKVESCEQIADRCAPRKICNDAEKFNHVCVPLFLVTKLLGGPHRTPRFQQVRHCCVTCQDGLLSSDFPRVCWLEPVFRGRCLAMEAFLVKPFCHITI
jgi:hypothetical protein